MDRRKPCTTTRPDFRNAQSKRVQPVDFRFTQVKGRHDKAAGGGEAGDRDQTQIRGGGWAGGFSVSC